MIKNAIVYRITSGLPSQPDMEELLAKTPFTECGLTQAQSSGWTPPRGEKHGALVENVGGEWVLSHTVETRAVPASALARAVDEKAARIEKEDGRKPGKKERRELKEEARLDLLPHAFPKRSACWCWIDTQARLLVLDTASQGRADAVATALIEAVPGLAPALLQSELLRRPYTVKAVPGQPLEVLSTPVSSQEVMSQWLAEQGPPGLFELGHECELKAPADAGGAVVRYGRHPLDIDEVRAHIQAGKLPARLELTWNGLVRFVLTDSLQLRKIVFIDQEGPQARDENSFDVDTALSTGELRGLIADLVQALSK